MRAWDPSFLDGTGGVETDGDDVRRGNPCQFCGDLETVCNLLQADVWPLLGERGVLAQALDEKLLLLVH